MNCTLSLRLTAVLLLGGAALPAQSAGNPVVAEVKQMYNGVKNNLVKMAEKMPEEHYSFKASPDIRTFGQLIAHVADSQGRTCSTMNGEAKQLGAGKMTAKADLVNALKESFAWCDKAVEATTDANAMEMMNMGRGQRSRIGALMGMISHSNLEYGYTAVYMRIKGIVPPSSEPR